MIVSIVAALALLATGSVAGAAEPPACDLTVAEEAGVAAITDGRSFELQDGRHVRLAAIQTPAADWPRARDAKDRLAALVAGKTVGLAYGERAVDRHGYLVAQVYVDETGWLQRALIDDGLARVQTRSDMRRCARQLLTVERKAREAKRGIWSDPFYRVRKADDLADDIGTFQIVEAKVIAVAAVHKRVFVNFGPDHRTDFTVTVSAADRRRLSKEGVDPLLWTGKTIRVRGWISLLNGPEIELTHPEQIEVLD